MRLDSRRRAALARVPLGPTRQRLKLEPFSFSTVRAPASRFCSTWNRPFANLPNWVPPPVMLRAVSTCTRPFLVSISVPTGTWRGSISGTKPWPFWAAPALPALAKPAGSLMKTSSSSTDRLAVLPNTGGGSIPPRSGQPLGVLAATSGQESVRVRHPVAVAVGLAALTATARRGTTAATAATAATALLVRRLVLRRVVVEDRPET